MRRFVPAALVAASLALSGTVSAQLNFPEIPYDAVAPLTLPQDIHLGEAAGVATNSKGEIFVYTRTGTPRITTAGSRAVSHGGARLFQFDRTGKFVREMGQGAYGFLQAQQVRVDPQDNIWVVDQMSTQVIKFDPNGRIQMVLSRKPEAMRVPALPMATAPDTYALVPPRPPAPAGEGRGGAPPAAAPAGGRGGALPGAGAAGESFNRPTDVAWDSTGNIYVADGYGNSRVAKYDRNGKWIKNWGSAGTGDGQFRNVGSPWAICITPGARQFLYVSNSNPPNNLDYDGEILKMSLDGRIVGKFGRAGKMLKEFGTVNAIDCRTENELYVGELGNWRVQKVMLKPAAGTQ